MIKLIIMILVALIISSIGFKKFVWFISLGYGFSIAGLGVAMFVIFRDKITIVTCVMNILFVVYGVRLGGYLLIRERKSASYQKTMKNDIKDGSGMKMLPKLSIWISCAVLYVLEVCPVFFRLENSAKDDAAGYIGMGIMMCGIILESASDYVKNNFKKSNPHRFCDVGMFKLVRCPNYFGEILTWTGVLISGITVYMGAFQWILAVLGWVCIVYIMFGGARRLEIRQNKNYGEDPQYCEYVKSVPIIIPLIPLYSVEKYKWLVG